MSTDFAQTVSDEALDRSQVEALSAQMLPMRLIRVELEGVDLAGLDFTGWAFEDCSLRRTRLIGARLEGSQWAGCRGGFADFSGAHLADAVFEGGDFNNGLFCGATLACVVFRRCKLTGADMTEARTLGIVFDETLLIAAKLPGMSFRKLTLKRLDFSQANLKKADFRDAVLEDCSLREANLAGARFQGADLRGADLGGLRLEDASLFRGATISRNQAGDMLAELGLNVR
jgi:fluoroquinolone resistance protein